MDKETYEALKRILKYGTWDKGIGDNDITMVETWIDEAEKNYKKEIERKRKNTKRRHDLWKRQLGIKTWKEHRKEKGLISR
jgi:hypothetical protein